MDDAVLKNSNPEWDSIEIYFEAGKWSEFSDYEKERFLNLKKNYEVLKSIGLNPKVPQFMLFKKKAESKSSVKISTETVNSRSSNKGISKEEGVATVAKDGKPKDGGESIPSSLESTSESNGARRSDYHLPNEERENVLRNMLPQQYDNLKGKELWQTLMKLEWKPDESTVTLSTKNSVSLLFNKVQTCLGNLHNNKEGYLRNGLPRLSEDEGNEDYNILEDKSIKESIGVSNDKEKGEIIGTLGGRDIGIDSPSENDSFEFDSPSENEITENDSPSRKEDVEASSSKNANIEAGKISEREDIEVDSSSENESIELDSPSENEDVAACRPLEKENIEMDTLSEKEDNEDENAALEKEDGESDSALEKENENVKFAGVKNAAEKEDSVSDIAGLEYKEDNDVNSAAREEPSVDDIALLQEPEDDDNSIEVTKDFAPMACKKSSRYPRRKMAKVCYTEEDVCSDDELLFCDECEKGYEGDCPIHGPLMHVLDTPVPIGSCPDRAKRTCPAFISVCQSGIKGAGLGVWTEWGIAKGVVFGPYEGKMVKTLKEAKKSGYAWEIRRRGRPSHYVEASDPSISNWLRFVNCAPCEQRQNLIAFQFNGQIFYRTYKLIPPAAELLVWYGDNFAADLGITLCDDSDAGQIEISHIQSLLKTRNRLVRCPKLLRPRGNISAGAVCYTVETEQQQLNARIKMRNKYFSRTKSCSQREEEPGTSTEGDSSTERKGTNETKRNDSEKNCSHCDYKTSNIRHLNRHVDAVHMGLKPHKCKHCDYRASEAIALKRHVNAVHMGLKPHKCPQCDYRASTAENLKNHVNALHMGLKPHKCKHCDFRASRTANLKEHVNAVHMRLKPHKCKHCDYRASQAINLEQHVNAVHLGLKPHKCKHCDYRASQAIHLKEHVNAVHMGLKPHKCKHCDYRASQATVLKRHVNAVHMGLKPHKCKHCDCRASQATALKRHVNAVHMGLKPHKCFRCNYRASTAGSLKNHVNAMHMGLKPHKCPHCKSAYPLLSSVLAHVKSKHEKPKS